MVDGLEVTARCLVFICQGEGGAAGLLQVRASLGVLSWWCRRGKGGRGLEVAAGSRRKKKGGEGKEGGKKKKEKTKRKKGKKEIGK
jgi:hypothetical protein